jgi:hypothetical protein
MKLFLSLTFLIVVITTYAQETKHNYVWMLGNNDYYPDKKSAGIKIDFNFSPPTIEILKIPIEMGTTNSSISDKNGNLVLYTNGCAIANKKHLVMSNGNGLNPGLIHNDYCDLGYISEHGVIVLPHPKNDSLYRVYHTALEYFKEAIPWGTTTLYETKVNAAAKNGNGAVIQKNKVIFKDTLSDNQFSAVKHGNGRDWWLISPEWGGNRYYKFLVTPEEVKGPFTQKFGVSQRDTAFGSVAISPDGRKYARPNVYRNILVMDFDRCSGLFTKELVIPVTIEPYWVNRSLCFSPNSRFLYSISFFKIYQYDLEADDVTASKVLVATYDGFKAPQSTAFLSSQLAPDGRIYINCPGGSLAMHTINKPNEKGLACDVQQHSIILDVYNQRSLPYFPNYNLGALKGSPCDTIHDVANKENILEKENIQIFPNPATENISIHFDEEKSYDLIIKDIVGRIIHKAKIGNGRANFETSNLPNGLVICEFWNNTQCVKQEKIVIIH